MSSIDRIRNDDSMMKVPIFEEFMTMRLVAARPVCTRTIQWSPSKLILSKSSNYRSFISLIYEDASPVYRFGSIADMELGTDSFMMVVLYHACGKVGDFEFMRGRERLLRQISEKKKIARCDKKAVDQGC